MYLLPKPQKMELLQGKFLHKTVNIDIECNNERIRRALQKLPSGNKGALLKIEIIGNGHESYTLKILKNSIEIIGSDDAGVFYAIQTLRQILKNRDVPCLIIEDYPGLEYRGFYHDVTRGKVPKVETIKKLIDNMAYYKLNSLQLYIEHTFSFKEFGCNIEKTGYLTPDEIREIDSYCYENFIEFIPSIATFGHLFELLERKEYRELREIDDYVQNTHKWHARQIHHTIDPTNERSFETVKSMIDQFYPLFSTDKFNICCDETFDLVNGRHKNQNTAELYINFVKRIVEYLKSKGKTVMMWADILLKYPETIKKLPENMIYLNWNYSPTCSDEAFRKFYDIGAAQIVCPGTWSWYHLSELIGRGTENIARLGEYAYKFKAKGMLNTNWGDYGNPCCIEMAMHGLVFGACISWNRNTTKDEEFNKSINFITYKHENAEKYIKMLGDAQEHVSWRGLAELYSNHIFNNDILDPPCPEKNDLLSAADICRKVIDDLSEQKWEIDDYRQEAVLSAEGILVLVNAWAVIQKFDIKARVNVKAWFERFRNAWIEKNKKDEMYEIEGFVKYLENPVVK